MTDNSRLFFSSERKRLVPLFEGKMIHQYDIAHAKPRYWVDPDDARWVLLGREKDSGQKLSYQKYRLAHRAIGRSTDERAMIAAMLPPMVLTGHSINIVESPEDSRDHLFLQACLNSFSFDYYLRQQVSANLTQYFIYQCPVPRLLAENENYTALVTRSSQLSCTTAEFDELAIEAGLRGHRDGATDPVERARLRAEIDGLVAHLYGLTDEEFLHMLATFPLVPEPVKVAAYNAFRDVARGLIQ
jgi:hypothetical protein